MHCQSYQCWAFLGKFDLDQRIRYWSSVSSSNALQACSSIINGKFFKLFVNSIFCGLLFMSYQTFHFMKYLSKSCQFSNHNGSKNFKNNFTEFFHQNSSKTGRDIFSFFLGCQCLGRIFNFHLLYLVKKWQIFLLLFKQFSKQNFYQKSKLLQNWR